MHLVRVQVAAAVAEHPELEAALRAKNWQYIAEVAANSALTRLHSSTASVMQQVCDSTTRAKQKLFLPRKWVPVYHVVQSHTCFAATLAVHWT